MRQNDVTMQHWQGEIEDDYPSLEKLVAERVSQAGVKTLFVCDRSNLVSGLYDYYLFELPPSKRKHYDCRACRQFVEKYGPLVEVDEKGRRTTLLWEPDGVPGFFAGAFAAVRNVVQMLPICGVYVNDEVQWGRPVTGPWTHLCGRPNDVYSSPLKTASQRAAEYVEDYKMLRRSLAEYTIVTTQRAYALLSADAVHRPEKALERVKWLLEIADGVKHKNEKVKDALVWRAVASAPAGWCHVKSSVVGTLLDDIEAGMSVEEVSARWNKKVRGDLYMRPTAAPKVGTIQQAERIVESLGIAESLKRRFAKLDEVCALWRRPTPRTGPTVANPVFGNLLGLAAERPTKLMIADLPEKRVTWSTLRGILENGAEEVEVKMPTPLSRQPRMAFMALVTEAVHGSRPVLQWDREERRNPVSWYMYTQGNTPQEFNMRYGAWERVNAVCLKPCDWYQEEPDYRFGKSVLFLLEGCRDMVGRGYGLFPECLKSELHSVRSVIEAHMGQTTLGISDSSATACGVSFDGSGNSKMASELHLRVDGRLLLLDRWS